MSTKQYSSMDFQGLSIINFTLEVLGSDPSAPTAGARMYYHSGQSAAKVITTGGVITRIGVSNIVDADVAAGAAIQESKLSLATDAAAGVGSRRTLAFTSTAAMPGNARLDQIAAPTASVAMNNQKITGLLDPGAAQDAATQAYVLAQIDLRVSGQTWKDSVRVASPAATNITIASPGATIDGVTMASGNRVLLKAQTLGQDNGIYVWNGAATPMTRALDANTSAEVTSGLTIAVQEGTSGNQVWMLTTDNPITLGTTPQTWTQIGAGGTAYTASTGITLAGNDFQLVVPVTVANGGTGGTSAATARTSLGVPQKGFAVDLTALSAGVEATFAHGLGTADLAIDVRDKTSGYQVGIDVGADATNIKVTSAIAVSSGVLRVTAVPIA